MEKVSLNTNEIGTLWAQYVENSLYAQIFKYLIRTVEDSETEKLLNNALNLSERVQEQSKHFFTEDEIPIPNGFTENDVNLNADKLFLDPFMLLFLEHTLKAGLLTHGSSLMICTRKDVRNFFTQTLNESQQIFNSCIDLSLKKGILNRPPDLNIQPNIEYVESKKYMSPFGHRPLSTIELTHLFENIKTNTVGTMITMAFGQTTDSEEISAYMRRGLNISQKHIKLFDKAMHDSFIDAPMGSNSYVTGSTNRVFSDKLMMHLMSILSAAGQGNYATASTASMRYDLTLNYQRLSVEIALYAKDGAEIMIEKGWLEEPPQAPDRKKLLKH